MNFWYLRYHHFPGGRKSQRAHIERSPDPQWYECEQWPTQRGLRDHSVQWSCIRGRETKALEREITVSSKDPDLPPTLLLSQERPAPPPPNFLFCFHCYRHSVETCEAFRWVQANYCWMTSSPDSEITTYRLPMGLEEEEGELKEWFLKECLSSHPTF